MHHRFGPGSLMLLGEHAVLYGRRALVCAVDRRIRVTLRPAAGDRVRIESALGRVETTLGRLRIRKPFRFVLASVDAFRGQLPSGFNCVIESDLSHEVGFGSSAAVTVATCAALMRWRTGRVARQPLFERSREIIRRVQGAGSGADAAASVFGGMIAYRAAPLRRVRLKGSFPITALYSGGKTPTPEVIARVRRAHDRHPRLFDAVFDAMDVSVREAAAAIRRKQWSRVGEILDAGQGLMEAIGVSNARLSEMVCALRSDPDILGAKISGSGLGDCVIGLGRSRRDNWPWPALPVRITQTGVTTAREYPERAP